MTSNDAEFEYVRGELERLEQIWENEPSGGSLVESCGGLVVGYTAPGKAIANAAISALVLGEPFSMVRIGEGEGNILGCIDPQLDSTMELRWFNRIFSSQSGVRLELDEAVDFAKRLEAAATESDILGVRTFQPWVPLEDCRKKVIEYSSYCLGRGDLRGALGLLRAEDQVLRWAKEERLVDKTLTHAWAYKTLLEELTRILPHARSVLLISGRSEIFSAFAKRYAETKKLRCIDVPLEPGLKKDNRLHYPRVFGEVMERLDGDLTGCLALVGAGIFGKIYCSGVQKSGGVALDLGSGFDILAGLKTRPAHADWLIPKYRLV